MGNATDDDDDDFNGGTYASPPCFMHELGPEYLGLPAAPKARRKAGKETPENAKEKLERVKGIEPSS